MGRLGFLQSLSILKLLGHASVLTLAIVFVTLNAVAVYELDFWQSYFFKDTLKLTEDCQVQHLVSGEPPELAYTLLRLAPIRSMRVPHPSTGFESRNDLPQFARYRCQLNLETLKEASGQVLLHLGWIFSDKAHVVINGVDRTTTYGNDKVVVSLLGSDLDKKKLDIDIQMQGSKDRFGMRGYAPIAITAGNQQTSKVLGLEIALQQIRYLYGILPVLAIGLIFSFGWFKGMHSWLLVALFQYFLMITLRNLVPILVDFWPWDVITTYRATRALNTGSYLAFCLLLAEFLQTFNRRIPLLLVFNLVITLVFFGLIVGNLAAPGFHSWIHRANPLVFSLLIFIIVIFARKNIQKLSPQRRRAAYVFLGIAICYAVLSVIDFAFDVIGIAIVISNKIDIVMPLFVGGAVLNAISLIQTELNEERKAREKIDNDLALARKIQDSLAPPRELQKIGNLEIRSFHEKHNAVAGDWLAVKHGDDGRCVLIVADATGKGIQAALVVHALQSLWAEHQNDLARYPHEWLERVNRTLAVLGEGAPHSMTIGLCVVDQRSLQYWSAGHLPLFIVERIKQQDKVTPLAARGQILGVVPRIEMQAKTYTFPEEGEVEIILATDGVLDRGSMTRARDILALREKIIGESLNLRTDCRAEDDKTLVYLKRTA